MFELINPKTGALTEKASLEIITRKKFEAENKIFFDRLKDEMNRYAEATGDVSGYEDDILKISYRQGSTRKTIDTTSLKKNCPKIAERYTKETTTKPSWTIEVK